MSATMLLGLLLCAAALYCTVMVWLIVLRFRRRRAGGYRWLADSRPAGDVAPVVVGQRCPSCQRGTVYVTHGRYGSFLGCTQHRPDRRGCERAWQLNGYPFPPGAPRW